jgi:excisionase family DNA binding protein
MNQKTKQLSVTETAPYTELSSKPLSVMEASAYTKLSKAYIYKLIHEKRISHFKPNNGKVYFLKEDLDAYIYRGRVSADYELREQAEQLLTGRKV